MKRVLSLAACAAMALTSACGGEEPSRNEVQADVTEALNDAGAAINEAEMATENAAAELDAPPPTAEGREPLEPTVAPPPPPPPSAPKSKAAPATKAEPKASSAPKAPAEPKAPAADPHAGHDMSNMSHGNMSH